MNLKELIKEVEKQEFDPTIGLPETLFEFATRITPMVNVDLLLEILRKKFCLLGEVEITIHQVGIFLEELCVFVKVYMIGLN